MDKVTMIDRIPSTKDYNKLTDKVGWGVREEKIDEFKIENPDIRTYLGASKGKEDFYKKFGFKIRKEANLGEGMVLF